VRKTAGGFGKEIITEVLDVMTTQRGRAGGETEWTVVGARESTGDS